MATDLAEKAREAFIDDDFQTAVDLYTQAISLNPNSADLFAERAQANLKLNYFTEAVADANKAIELDPSMTKAYLRKGVACLKLEEYQTAKAALERGASLGQKDTRFTKLITECNERIAEEINDVNPLKPEGLPTAAHSPAGPSSTEKTVGSVKEKEAVQPKYRHTYYQKPEEVVVTIFAKGIPAEKISVEFGEQILSVTIDVPGEDKYHFQTRLFGKIVPDKCRFEVLSTKVEIRLVKSEPVNWPSLEYSRMEVVPQKLNASVGVVSQRPAYPSSKPRKKDWDKLEAQVKKEEKEEKLDGDAAVNKMFGEIYKSADEDVRRAMMKSFVESNGTVLSTNWKEVGSKKVESSPPDSMELKKWEY